jgi:hypothetical protein
VIADSLGATTILPFNSTSYAGPTVGTANLDEVKVTPGNTTSGQPITFSVRYTSTANTAPLRAQIQLDGITYDMTPTGPLNYASGVTYSYTTSSLGIGTHFNRFVFDDGTGPWILEGSDLPTISPFTISGPGVSPATGSTSTSYSFQVTYTSVDSLDPTNGALVYIDNVAQPMTYISETSLTGALYNYTTTLDAGSYTYYFLFANASNEWPDPLGPGQFTMTVSSNVNAAAPVSPHSVGHTIIAPSHDEDPDQGQYPIDPAPGPTNVANPQTDDDD